MKEAILEGLSAPVVIKTLIVSQRFDEASPTSKGGELRAWGGIESSRGLSGRRLQGGLSTQGIGLWPQPWAPFYRPVGPGAGTFTAYLTVLGGGLGGSAHWFEKEIPAYIRDCPPREKWGQL